MLYLNLSQKGLTCGNGSLDSLVIKALIKKLGVNLPENAGGVSVGDVDWKCCQRRIGGFNFKYSKRKSS